MASIYPKERSPFWFIRYRDIRTGKTKDHSTKLRRDDSEQTRAARRQCAERTAQELSAPAPRSGDDWQWVEQFFVAHYENERSRDRARAAWFNLTAYFRSLGISSPGQLTREHCMNYKDWRLTSPETKAFGLREAQHNTARVELQHLSAVMREAVHRGKAASNPVLQLGIKRVAGKKKPEITPSEQRIVEKKLSMEGDRAYNEDMRIAWAIAMRYGRRLIETAVPLTDVNLEERTITFRTKGGEEKTKLLHPELVPLFRRLKKEKGRTHAHQLWPNWSKKWRYFFKRCGLPHLSHRSIRVTVVNELRRKGVDPRLAREYVDHSSVIIHETYERQRLDEQIAAARALGRGTGRLSLSSNGRGRKRSK